MRDKIIDQRHRSSRRSSLVGGTITRVTPAALAKRMGKYSRPSMNDSVAPTIDPHARDADHSVEGGARRESSTASARQRSPNSCHENLAARAVDGNGSPHGVGDFLSDVESFFASLFFLESFFDSFLASFFTASVFGSTGGDWRWRRDWRRRRRWWNRGQLHRVFGGDGAIESLGMGIVPGIAQNHFCLKRFHFAERKVAPVRPA